jgi:hypothetical protein
MTNFTRLTTVLALAFPLVLAGCGDNSDKTHVHGKPPAEQGPDGKSPTTPAAEAKTAPAAKEEKIDPEEEVEIKKNLAKLSAEDRNFAEAQRFCAVEEENRLGSMGPPLKLTVKGKTVFVCCGSCKKQALADPDKTLAKAAELKSKAAAPAK